MTDGYDAFRKAVEQFFPGGFTIRDEANGIVAYAFRNGPLERLHSGEASELLENPKLSRITNAEMKELMLNACEHMEKLLRLKQDDPAAYYQKIIEFNLQLCREWDRQSVQPSGQTSDLSTTAADTTGRLASVKLERQGIGSPAD